MASTPYAKARINPELIDAARDRLDLGAGATVPMILRAALALAAGRDPREAARVHIGRPRRSTRDMSESVAT